MSGQEKSRQATLRDVPSVDQLLRTDAARELRDLVGIQTTDKHRARQSRLRFVR